MYKCFICGKELTVKNYTRHIKTEHKMESKDYYDKYIRKDGEGICPTCGKETPFINVTYGYKWHCNQKCANNNPQIVERKKQTTFDHFGTTTYLNTSDSRQKCKKVLQSEEVKEKRNQTMLKLYGSTSTMHSPIILEKIKNTNQQKYGTDYPFQSQEIQNKCLDTLQTNHGVSNPYNIPEIQAKANNKESRTKMQQTSLEHFGVESPLQSREVRLKGIKTMKANGNYSKLEDFLEEVFIKQNIIYEHNYNKDDRYKYHCDFYLPDKDLFIEINGWWHHGKHWYNANDAKDQKTLQVWQKRVVNKPQYQAAIETWTKRDIEKRNMAQQNQLNYVVLWSKQDILQWIEDGFPVRKDYL